MRLNAFKGCKTCSLLGSDRSPNKTVLLLLLNTTSKQNTNLGSVAQYYNKNVVILIYFTKEKDICIFIRISHTSARTKYTTTSIRKIWMSLNISPEFLFKFVAM